LKRLPAWAAPALIAGLFLAAASRSLSLPGLWYDESQDTSCGMELALGLPRTPTDWSVTIGGRAWPLRVEHAYDFSAFGIYWSALAFRVGGVAAATMRFSALLLAAGALLAFHGFCRRAFSPRVAAAACALLAAHPAFLVWSRVAYFASEIFLIFFASLALYFGSLWRERRAPWALYAACFALGFSANASTKALAFILALPAVFFLWAPRAWRPGPRQAAAGAGFLVLGALNPLAFCLSNAVIVRSLAGALAGPTRAGVDNLAFASNAATRLSQLAAVLSGRSAAWQAAGPLGVSAPAVAWVCAASLLALAWRSARARDEASRRRGGALVSVCVLLFLETCLTPMALNPQHLLVVLPFLLLAAAAALELLPAATGALLACGLLAAEARVDAAYFSALRSTGGVGLWSQAPAEAARYLEEAGVRRPLCLSWGLSRNMYLASAGQVAPESLQEGRGRAGAEQRRRLDEALRDPSNRYLAFADGISNLGQRSGVVLEFRRAAQAARKRLVVERAFDDRAGEPVLLVYKAVPWR
jgi:hypothetical protein